MLGKSGKLILLLTMTLNFSVFAQPDITVKSDFRNSSFDSLNVVKEKKYGVYGNRKSLIHTRKFDEEGYIIQQDYYNEKRCLKKRKMQRVRYEYSVNRDTVSELHFLRDGLKWDTSYLVVHVFDISGKLLTKIQTFDSTEERYEYEYDNFGNCILERRSRTLAPTLRIQYDYVYDSLDRITTYSRTNGLGFVTKEEFYYTKYGELLEKRTNDSLLVEKYAYNENSHLISYEYDYDSLSVMNTGNHKFSICISGGEYYTYDSTGLLKDISYSCEELIEKEIPFNQPLREMISYELGGLISKRLKVYDSNNPKLTKAEGIIYKYY